MSAIAANLFADVPAQLADELVDILAESPDVRIERIVSRGQASPPGFWYDQDEAEWVALLSGGARLTLRNPDQTLDLGPGDHLLIEPHRRHRVDWTSSEPPAIWLAVFYNSD